MALAKVLNEVKSMEDLQKLRFDLSDLSSEDGVTPEADAENEVKSYTKEMVRLGGSILRELGEEAKGLGSASGTLHFQHLLGLASKPTVRKTENGVVTCPTTVGVTLVSDKAIEVPVISVLKNKDTGITAKDISSRRVRKGVPFHLNMYELMFLLVRKEYAGFMEFNGDPQGVRLSPKMSYFYSGKAKFPTPTLLFKFGMGSIKDHMVTVDEKVDGKWRIREEFKKEFGELIPEGVKRHRKSGKAVMRYPTTVMVSLALGKILEDQLKQEA